MIITSKSNKIYKFIDSLKKKKYRVMHNKFTVEGINPVADAIDAKADIFCICMSESFSHENDISTFSKFTIYIFKDELFNNLCCTVTPQGILACVNITKTELSEKSNGFYLYCDGVNDPGNAGTIIRIADACGCDGVLFSNNSVDIYSDKTIRASMGSFFHLPILDHMDISWLMRKKECGYRIIGGILDKSSIPYTEALMKFPVVIVVGNEANGISKEVQNICTHKVIIPIYGSAESLNVGVAAALLCYESRRQEVNC